MRTGPILFHSSPLAKTTKAAATSMPPTSLHSTTWHSPVPYLFGGLAAMLGLIAFALLILVCSYWKISGEDEEGGSDEKGDGGSDSKAPPIFEEKVLVIMAGELKPTFLATPRTCCAKENGDESDDR